MKLSKEIIELIMTLKRLFENNQKLMKRLETFDFEKFYKIHNLDNDKLNKCLRDWDVYKKVFANGDFKKMVVDNKANVDNPFIIDLSFFDGISLGIGFWSIVSILIFLCLFLNIPVNTNTIYNILMSDLSLQLLLYSSVCSIGAFLCSKLMKKFAKKPKKDDTDPPSDPDSIDGIDDIT